MASKRTLTERSLKNILGFISILIERIMLYRTTGQTDYSEANDQSTIME